MESTYRQCLMLGMIPRHPKKTDTATLKAQLEDRGFAITQRTIQRDLDALSTVFPLVRDEKTKPYGWSWAKDAELFSMPHMDSITAFSFRMVREFLTPAIPPTAIKALKPHFDMADKVLKMLPIDQLRAWPDKIRILSRSQRLSPPSIDPDVLETVYESLMEEKRFTALYRRRNEDAAVSYVVNPLGIVLLDAVIYLVCTLRNYNRLEDVRQLSLHRFVSAEKTEESVLAPKNFTMKSYIDTGAFNYLQSTELIRFAVLFDKKTAIHLYETPLSADQEIFPVKDDDTRVMVKATVADTSQLRWWLLGFGPLVEVVEPDFLRDEFRTRAMELAEIYIS